MNLKGKRIVITGASSGIGWALLKRLSASGASVVGVSRNPQRIIDELGNRGIKTITCDVSDPIQVDPDPGYPVHGSGSTV